MSTLNQRFAPDYTTLWRSVGDRCAIDLTALTLEERSVFSSLFARGFVELMVDVVEEARALVGVAPYERNVHIAHAPHVVNCSTLVWWCYRQRGILLPRYAVNQRQASVDVGIRRRQDLKLLRAGDLVFLSGMKPYGLGNLDGVGHVGIATGDGTIIHAANKDRGVVEEKVASFIGRFWSEFKGAGRIIPEGHEVKTLLTPPGRPVFWGTDLRCLLAVFPRTGNPTA